MRIYLLGIAGTGMGSFAGIAGHAERSWRSGPAQPGARLDEEVACSTGPLGVGTN